MLAAGTPLADVAGGGSGADAGSAENPTSPAALLAHRAVVIAHVGPRAITAGELEDRLARIPRYQLRTFGRTRAEIARTYFEKVFLRDILLSEGAEEKHLDRDIAVEQGIERVLSGATLRVLIDQVGTPNAITEEERQQYYDANRTRFDAKPKISIWRILCKTSDEALGVIAEAKKDGSVQEFTKLARDHSLDKATNLRGGNLGFIAENGISSEPGVMVSPAVLRAAQAVKDGELVQAPVQEGTSFAVVWRRGTQLGVHRAEDSVKAQIDDALIKQKRGAAERELLERLRREKVSGVDEGLLGTFDVAVDDGTIGAKRGR